MSVAVPDFRLGLNDAILTSRSYMGDVLVRGPDKESTGWDSLMILDCCPHRLVPVVCEPIDTANALDSGFDKTAILTSRFLVVKRNFPY